MKSKNQKCEHNETEFAKSLKDVLDRNYDQTKIRNNATETARKIEKMLRRYLLLQEKKESLLIGNKIYL